jgi:sporulation protein YlmC with PRC-barrel domain
MQMAIDDLPGRSVLDNTGRVLGQVDGFVVDTESWAINSLRVRLRRAAAMDIGLAWSPFRAAAIDVPTGLVFAASDVVILRATLEELQGLVAQSAPVAA